MNWIKQDGDTIILSIYLTPNAKNNCIKGVTKRLENNHALKVYVTSIAENNKANLALIKLLSKKFKLPKGRFKILSGQKNRNKTILIQNINPDIYNTISTSIESIL